MGDGAHEGGGGKEKEKRLVGQLPVARSRHPFFLLLHLNGRTKSQNLGAKIARIATFLIAISSRCTCLYRVNNESTILIDVARG